MLVHYYLTYVQDFDENLYTFREGVQLFQIYFQGVILGLSVEKYTTLFLILIEGGWLAFNILLDLTREGDYKFRLYLMSGLIMLGYIFLSFGNKINVGSIVVVTLIVITLIVYCSYQIIGIYYWLICGCCGREED